MSKYFIKEAERIEAAKKAGGLLGLEMRRRKFLKASLGAGIGLAGVATLAGQCGSSGGTAVPTATTAAGGTTTEATATIGTAPAPTATIGTAPAPTATTASGGTTSAFSDADYLKLLNGPDIEEWLAGVPVMKDHAEKPPYGYSGIADRAIEAAKNITNKNTIGMACPAGSRGNWEPFIAEWKAVTGIDVKIIEIPLNEIYEKVMQGAVTKTPDWDIVVMQSRGMGDMLGAGASVDWTDYEKKYDPVPLGKPWGCIGDAPAQFVTRYKGAPYALLTDGDIYTNYYRRDYYEDPKEREGFKAKYGYDMVMDTWEHYRDVCEWFTRPDKNFYGSCNLRARNWGFFWWEMVFASQAIPNAYYFDDDMNPAIDSPEGIGATKTYASFKKASHPDIGNWDWSGMSSFFLGGNAFSTVTWGTIALLARDETTSKIPKGKLGFGLIPGAMVNGKLNRRNTYAFGINLMGWAHGKADKEAAYCWAQFLSSPEVGARGLTHLAYTDPWRYTHMNDPIVQQAYSAPFLKVFYENYKLATPDIYLQGAGEFIQFLDSNIQEAWVGSKTPEDAMKATSDSWKDIIDRLGKDSLKEVWAVLKSYYPTIDTSFTVGKDFLPLP